MKNLKSLLVCLILVGFVACVPQISSVTPNRITSNNGAYTITVSGSGFASGDSVIMGNETTTVLSITSDSIVVDFTPQAQFSFLVQVVNVNGTYYNPLVILEVIDFVCPRNSQSTIARPTSISDCKCIPGYFGESASSCDICPYGAVCVGGNDVFARRGYFMEGFTRGGFPIINACPIPNQCLGGRNNSCAQGSWGQLCAQCKPGFYKNNVSGCRYCPSNTAGHWVMVVLLFFVFLFVLKRSVRSPKGERSVTNFLLALAPHLQLLASFNAMRMTSFDFYLRDVLSLLEVFNLQLDAGPISCTTGIVSSFEARMWISVLTPFVIAIGILMRVGGQHLRSKLVEESEFDSKFPNFSEEPDTSKNLVVYFFSSIRYYVASLFFVVEPVTQETWRLAINEVLQTFDFLYIPLMVTPFEALQCNYLWNILPNGDQCPPPDMRALAFFFMIGFGIGVPLVQGIILMRAKNKDRRESEEFASKFSSLFGKYREDKYWWQIVVTLRKGITIYAIVSVGVESDEYSQMAIGSLITIVFAFAHFAHAPHERTLLNRFENALYLLTVVILVGGMLLKSSATTYNVGTWMLAITFIILFVVLTGIVLFAIREHFKKLRFLKDGEEGQAAGQMNDFYNRMRNRD